MLKRIIGALAVLALALALAPGGAQAAEQHIGRGVYDCSPTGASWSGWLTEPGGANRANFCPGNDDVNVTGSEWRSWDRTQDGLCAEIWVSYSATGSFVAVAGTKACGMDVIRAGSLAGGGIWRARLVKTYTNNSGWANSGWQFWSL